MKRALLLARAFGGAFGLVLLGFVAHATLPLPATNGPFLGDVNTNLFTVVQALSLNNQMGVIPTLSVSQTSGQANCTQLNGSAASMWNVTTSAATGYVCLPTAVAGRELFIGNATTQTIDLYGSATTFTSGTQDTINGTAGTTAYTGLVSGKNATCFSPANGAWYCASGN